jgi:dolichyl-phosphate beta-glucosyltransferase
VRVFMDADLSTDIDDVVACFRCLEQDAADVVVATRSHPDSRIDHRRPSLRAWSGWSYNLVLRALGLTRLRDTQCGLKGFTAAAAEVCFRDLRVAGFAFDIEVLSRADHAGLRILESPVGWAHVPESRVNAVRDAPKMVRDTLGVWWAHRRGDRVGESRLPSLASDGVILDLTEPQTDPVGGPIIEASPVRAAGF